MRVGIVIRTVVDKSFGFIKADEFRDDVFFHFSVIDESTKPETWEPGFEVEFEIDDQKRREENLLRATIVQPASRPMKHSLDDRTPQKLKANHHPKARQRKPSWRKRTAPDDE